MAKYFHGILLALIMLFDDPRRLRAALLERSLDRVYKARAGRRQDAGHSSGIDHSTRARLS